MRKQTDYIYKALFWIYIVALLLIVVIKFNGNLGDLYDRMLSFRQSRIYGAWHINLVPFHSIKMQLSYIPQGWAVKNLVGNVIPFIPFGILLPLAYSNFRRLLRFMLSSVVFIVGIELFQFISMLGVFDVDDIILNLIGIFIGYITFKITYLLRWIKNKH